MRGLKRKTAIILASAVVTTSILAGGTLTAFAAGPDGAGIPGELPPMGFFEPGPSGSGGAPETQAAPAYTCPVLNVSGEIYGTADTAGASCLIDGGICYEHGVTLSLSQDVDDSKIDSSNAKVELVAGDGYTTTELCFAATQLTGSWQNGQLEYTLGVDDLTWDNSQYAITETSGCGREWSCFGGDGAGNYYFNLQVSGILYDGTEIPSQIIPVHVYIYGRSATDLAVMNFGTLSPAWKWNGTSDKPILCDDTADEFEVNWPAGVDGSAVKTDDFIVTLQSQYGKQKTLTPGTDYTVVSSSKGKTVVQVTYQNWAFTPVYTTMTLSVDPQNLSYDSKNYKLGGLSYTTDIASVYAYSVQSGGNMPIDHAVCYTYYGVQVDNWQQVQIPTVYRLQYTDEDGKTWYYASKYGFGYLTEDVSEAQTWDATGPDEMNYRVVDGHMVYLTLCNGHTAEKLVGLRKISFTKVYDSAYKAKAFDFYGSVDPCDSDGTLKLLPGYAMPETWLQHSMWAWKPDVGLGWTEN